MAKRKYWTIHDIEPEHILSTYHSGDKMVLCLDDCEEVKTTARFYEIEKILPEDEFVIIRKGIALRKSAIAAISDDGIYTMMDGETRTILSFTNNATNQEFFKICGTFLLLYIFLMIYLKDGSHPQWFNDLFFNLCFGADALCL